MQAWPTVEVLTIPASPSDQKVPERLVMVTTNNRRAVPIGPADGDAGLYVCGITPTMRRIWGMPSPM